MRPRTHNPGRAIAAPTTGPMTNHDVLDIATLAETYAARVTQIETYIEEHDLLNEWNKAVRIVIAETGVRMDYTRDESLFFTTYHDYDLTLAPEGVVLTGFHPHENDHTVTIPYGFLAAETRVAVLAPMRAEWSAKAETQRVADIAYDRQQAQEALRRAEQAVERARAEVAAFND